MYSASTRQQTTTITSRARAAGLISFTTAAHLIPNSRQKDDDEDDDDETSSTPGDQRAPAAQDAEYPIRQLIHQICTTLSLSHIVSASRAITSIVVTANFSAELALEFDQALLDVSLNNGIIVLLPHCKEQVFKFGTLGCEIDNKDYPTGRYVLASKVGLIREEIQNDSVPDMLFFDGRHNLVFATDRLLQDQMGTVINDTDFASKGITPEEQALVDLWKASVTASVFRNTLHSQLITLLEDHCTTYYPSPKTAFSVHLDNNPDDTNSLKLTVLLAADSRNPSYTYAGTVRQKWTCTVSPNNGGSGAVSDMTGQVAFDLTSTAERALTLKQSKNVAGQTIEYANEQDLAKKIVDLVAEQEAIVVKGLLQLLDHWSNVRSLRRACNVRFPATTRKFRQRMVMSCIGNELQRAITTNMNSAQLA